MASSVIATTADKIRWSSYDLGQDLKEGEYKFLDVRLFSTLL